MNPYPSPSPLQKFFLSELVSYAADCYRRHWNEGTAGNFSVRGSGDIFWQSPSGVPKGNLKPQDFIPVSTSRLEALRPQSRKPSDETPIHAAIYRRFPDARVVMHVHPPSLVHSTFGRNRLVFCGHEMAKALGLTCHNEKLVLNILDNSQDMVSLAEKVSAMDLPARLLILRGHGVYSWGRECYHALAPLEALEFLCQTSG